MVPFSSRLYAIRVIDMKDTMTWEQKLDAMQSIDRFFRERGLLKMLSPGEWSCVIPGFLVEGGMTKSSNRMGSTPEEAVMAAWAICTDSSSIIAVEGDRHVRWTGYMWHDVPKD